MCRVEITLIFLKCAKTAQFVYKITKSQINNFIWLIDWLIASLVALNQWIKKGCVLGEKFLKIWCHQRKRDYMINFLFYNWSIPVFLSWNNFLSFPIYLSFCPKNIYCALWLRIINWPSISMMILRALHMCVYFFWIRIKQKYIWKYILAFQMADINRISLLKELNFYSSMWFCLKYL